MGGIVGRSKTRSDGSSPTQDAMMSNDLPMTTLTQMALRPDHQDGEGVH